MTRYRTLVVLFIAALVSACGSGAGDVINTSGENTTGPRQVDRFVGVWQLSTVWSSRSNDDALLVIREPNSDGDAIMVIYDFTDETDSASQCYRQPLGTGRVYDSAEGTVFIDSDVFKLGIVAMSGNAMTIEFQDENDNNGNGNTNERLVATLTEVNQVESDIEPLC